MADTRIGLDVVVYDFRRGQSAEAIFEAYPSVGTLARVYGAITFILEHPAEVEAYLERSGPHLGADQGAISHASGHDRPF